jgi:hypothetical protein
MGCKGICGKLGHKLNTFVDGEQVNYAHHWRRCIPCECFFKEVNCPCCKQNTRGNAKQKRWRDDNKEKRKIILKFKMEKQIENK